MDRIFEQRHVVRRVFQMKGAVQAEAQKWGEQDSDGDSKLVWCDSKASPGR